MGHVEYSRFLKVLSSSSCECATCIAPSFEPICFDWSSLYRFFTHSSKRTVALWNSTPCKKVPLNPRAKCFVILGRFPRLSSSLQLRPKMTALGGTLFWGGASHGASASSPPTPCPVIRQRNHSWARPRRRRIPPATNWQLHGKVGRLRWSPALPGPVHYCVWSLVLWRPPPSADKWRPWPNNFRSISPLSRFRGKKFIRIGGSRGGGEFCSESGWDGEVWVDTVKECQESWEFGVGCANKMDCVELE